MYVAENFVRFLVDFLGFCVIIPQMKNQLYIPKDLKVGFQKRSETYTGRLGYVIYFDDKGKLRKETSWENWRHKPEDSAGRLYDPEKKRYYNSKETYGDFVAPIDLKNDPIEGFVLNKNAGGVHSGYGWNDRIEKVRVYDPRGFEFEISIPNLLFILQECNAIKGKGLEGEFVYSWDKTELVLLPTCSAEYKECLGFTKLQAKSVSKKDLIPGHLYQDKDENKYCYIGRDYFCQEGGGYSSPRVTKEHIVWEWPRYEGGDGFFRIIPSKLAEDLGECNEYNKILDEFKKTNHGKAVSEFVFEKEIGLESISTNYYSRFRQKYKKYIGCYKDENLIVSCKLNAWNYADPQKDFSFEIKNGETKRATYNKDLQDTFYDYHLLLEDGTKIPANKN